MTIDLHYKCGMVLFVSSVLGCLLPYQRKFDVTPVRPLSTGIIFGVAICHLLPDASEVLDTLQVTEWFMVTTHLEGSVGDDGLYDTLPIAEALMCFGIFIMLVIDQLIPCPHHQVQESSSEDFPPGEKTSLLLPTVVKTNGTTTSGSCGSGGHHHYNDGTIPKLPNAKVYATEVAIAIHSIIIGFTMGVNPKTDSLIGFTVAMIFHQMFEGIALAMIARQASLNLHGLCILVAVFASSLPIGICIGKTMYSLAAEIDNNNNDDDKLDLFALLFQGVPNAISSGMLLHIGFELMMEDFNHQTKHFPTSKLILAFCGGASIIFLAVWA